VQNFETVDRFLPAPGSAGAAAEIAKIGRDETRVLLRRNAGEENNFIFQKWELAELAIGGLLLLTLALGARAGKLPIGLTVGMLAIVGVQHFFLSPMVTSLGRHMADSPSAQLTSTFWMYHGIYSGAEILKLGIGAVLAFFGDKN
jgi:hypothetical protein